MHLPTLTADQRFVEYALEIGAIELSREGFVLKSGRRSPYFFNSAYFNDGQALLNLAEAYARTIKNAAAHPTVLYGPPYKGTILAPVVAAVAVYSHNLHFGYASSRKETKDHGEKGRVIGAPLSGAHVFIIDDVITTGDTKREAIDFIHAESGTVTGVVVAFDRQETVGETGRSARQLFEEDTGVPVYAAATLDDLIAVLETETDFPGNHPDVLPMIKAYKEQYGT